MECCGIARGNTQARTTVRCGASFDDTLPYLPALSPTLEEASLQQGKLFVSQRAFLVQLPDPAKLVDVVRALVLSTSLSTSSVP